AAMPRKAVNTGPSITECPESEVRPRIGRPAPDRRWAWITSAGETLLKGVEPGVDRVLEALERLEREAEARKLEQDRVDVPPLRRLGEGQQPAELALAPQQRGLDLGPQAQLAHELLERSAEQH